MTKLNKYLLCGVGVVVVGGAVATTSTYLSHHKKHQEQTKQLPNPVIKTELQEAEAIYFYDLLIKNGASVSRANLLINEVDNGRLSKQQLQNIIKTWKKDK